MRQRVQSVIVVMHAQGQMNPTMDFYDEPPMKMLVAQYTPVYVSHVLFPQLGCRSATGDQIESGKKEERKVDTIMKLASRLEAIASN